MRSGGLAAGVWEALHVGLEVLWQGPPMTVGMAATAKGRGPATPTTLTWIAQTMRRSTMGQEAMTAGKEAAAGMLEWAVAADD